MHLKPPIPAAPDCDVSNHKYIPLNSIVKNIYDKEKTVPEGSRRIMSQTQAIHR